MKKRFTRFGAFAVCFILTGSAALAQTNPSQAKDKGHMGHVMLQPSAMQWGDAPNSLPPGAKATILEGDPSKPGPFTIRMQAPAGYKIMPHYHSNIEHVTIIEGELFMGNGDKFDEAKATGLPAGSFSVIPEKTHHYAFTKSQPVILQLHGVGPWDIIYLDPTNDPRNAKKPGSK
jgi:hypothetical protein